MTWHIALFVCLNSSSVMDYSCIIGDTLGACRKNTVEFHSARIVNFFAHFKCLVPLLNFLCPLAL